MQAGLFVSVYIHLGAFSSLFIFFSTHRPLIWSSNVQICAQKSVLVLALSLHAPCPPTYCSFWFILPAFLFEKKKKDDKLPNVFTVNLVEQFWRENALPNPPQSPSLPIAFPRHLFSFSFPSSPAESSLGPTGLTGQWESQCSLFPLNQVLRFTS